MPPWPRLLSSPLLEGFRTGILNLEALYLLYGFLGKGFIVFLSEVNACENAVIIVKQFRQIGSSSSCGNVKMNQSDNPSS